MRRGSFPKKKSRKENRKLESGDVEDSDDEGEMVKEKKFKKNGFH